MGPLDPWRLFIRQFAHLPYPKKEFTGKTVIVTGSNIGLGLEAARHIVRLGAAKVILAVRTISKGEAAAESIARSTGITSTKTIEVWELDLKRRASVEAFAKRASEQLERLDCVVENAGILTKQFRLAEDNESTITVNVINTLYLGLLLLPKLRETSVKHDTEAVLTFTGSFVHFLTWFPEHKNPNILEALADPSKARMYDRYYVSKMIELFLVRELAAQVTAAGKPGRVTVSILNPGWVKSALNREGAPFYFLFFEKFVARETERGSRTLVHAAEGGPETHGQYLSDCRVS